MTEYKIRERIIRGGSGFREGRRYATEEWQVVLGRRVVGRHDLREQAERHVERLKAEAAALAATSKTEG